ncbi:hypothetical protein B0F90DRAFT_1821493 [Multifurca ochricompacta]|uniref:Uncharacterized protein n=1 Tax=Multifurca ochricompacta TaxID=376703 RepID=A0AAD4QKC5_9AGAM|nr:hypothetical protein B0F90DRAFT_1821493 [Multifurca ochricompacta]
MSANKSTIREPSIIFRSMVLCSGLHPPGVPTPSIHGIRVALRPGRPPDYPPPLPPCTIVSASEDGRSIIDSSNGYYTVRPYADILAESRLAAVRTKRARIMAALKCIPEVELRNLPTPVKRRVSLASTRTLRERRSRRTSAVPRALSNRIKLLGRAFPAQEAVTPVDRSMAMAYVKMSPGQPQTQYIFVSVVDNDDRMFSHEDDMQSIIEEVPSEVTTTGWSPRRPPATPSYLASKDVEMKSPHTTTPSATFSAIAAIINKPLNLGPGPVLPRFVFRSDISSMQEDVVMRECGPDGSQASWSPEFVKLVEPPQPVFQTGGQAPQVLALPTRKSAVPLTVSQQAPQPPPSQASAPTYSQKKGIARLRGVSEVICDTGRKERARRVDPYHVPQSSLANRIKDTKKNARRPETSSRSRPKAADFFDDILSRPAPRPPPAVPPPQTVENTLPPPPSYDEVYDKLSFAMAPPEEITARLRERADAFLGHLDNILGRGILRRDPVKRDVDSLFSEDEEEGNSEETNQNEIQPPLTSPRMLRTEPSMEDLFHQLDSMSVAQAVADPSEQYDPWNPELRLPIRLWRPSPGTPTRRSRNEKVVPLVIECSSDEDEDDQAVTTSPRVTCLAHSWRDWGLWRAALDSLD